MQQVHNINEPYEHYQRRLKQRGNELSVVMIVIAGVLLFIVSLYAIVSKSKEFSFGTALLGLLISLIVIFVGIKLSRKL